MMMLVTTLVTYYDGERLEVYYINVDGRPALESVKASSAVLLMMMMMGSKPRCVWLRVPMV